MGGRIRALILVILLLAVGVLAGSALSQWWEVLDTETGPTAVREVMRPSERVRVEVINAGGRANMAREATEALRERGFDVVYFGNASSFDQDSSVVLDRVGRLDLARAVADALGIGAVRAEPDSNLFLDVSVRLGDGWSPPPTPAVAPEAEARPWWDPRRLRARADSAPSLEQQGTMADPGSRGER